MLVLWSYWPNLYIALILMICLYIQGALELREKTVEDVMTPVDSAFMLDINTELDLDILNEVGVL